ncbi:MAG: hypothetical protein WBP79_12375 [Candidatus Acidiferrales bacterium]
MKRLLWIGVGVIVVLASAGAGYALFHGAPPIPKGSSPELIMLAPPDANLLAFIDLTAVRKAPVWSQIASASKADAGKPYQDFVDSTNFHIDTDLDHVLITASSESPDAALIVLDGRFDQSKISQFVATKGITSHHQTGDVYSFSMAPGSPMTAMMFVAPSRLAFGVGKGAETNVLVLAANIRDKSFQPREDVVERVKHVGGSPFFAVGDMPKTNALAVATLSGFGGDGVANAIQSMSGWDFAMWMDGTTLRMALEGECASIMDAIKVRVGLEKLRSKIKALPTEPSRSKSDASSKAAMDAMARGFDITLDGSYIRMSLSFTEDDMKIIQAAAKKP